MLFKKFTAVLAAIAMAVGGTAMAQDGPAPKKDGVAPASAEILSLLKADDEDCAKDAKKADCAPKVGCAPDHSWLHPKVTSPLKLRAGLGVRTSFQAWEASRDASNGITGGRTRDFGLDNARIFLQGTVGKNITGVLNTDINNAQPVADVSGEPDGIRILDAYIDYKISDAVSMKFGRFIPPTDRSNLSGPFFINSFEFPWVQHSGGTGHYDIFQGRDDGVVLYGNAGDGVLKWSAGVFEGIDNVADDNLMMVARGVVNLLDPEDGYFNQSTYYGEKEIMALGVTFSNQTNVNGTTDDYTVFSMDALYERPLDSGAVATLEAAYYDRNDDDVTGGTTTQGESYFIVASYLMADSVSIGNLEGRLQPLFRYQEADRQGDNTNEKESQMDWALNYIIHGHMARLALVLSDVNYFGQSDHEQRLTIGGQVRF